MVTLNQHLEQRQQTTLRKSQRGITRTVPMASDDALTVGPFSLETKRFGHIMVQPEQIWSFVLPLVGFDHVSEYVLLEHAPDSPFQWLQAVQDPELAFVITSPALFGLDYSVSIPEWALALLDAIDPELTNHTCAERFSILTLVSIPEDEPRNMTANLLAPIILYRTDNAPQSAQWGMQLVLQDNSYSTRVRLLPDTTSTTSKQTPQS